MAVSRSKKWLITPAVRYCYAGPRCQKNVPLNETVAKGLTSRGDRSAATDAAADAARLRSAKRFRLSSRSLYRAPFPGLSQLQCSSTNLQFHRLRRNERRRTESSASRDRGMDSGCGLEVWASGGRWEPENPGWYTFSVLLVYTASILNETSNLIPLPKRRKTQFELM